MVARISSFAFQIAGQSAKPSSRINKVAWAALAFFVAVIAVVIAKALRGRVLPPTSGHPSSSQPNRFNTEIDMITGPVSSVQVGDFYDEIMISLRTILKREKGIESYTNGKTTYTYYKGYPYVLVAALGGREAFDAIPPLVIGEENLYEVQKGINPYIKIEPKEMMCPIMKGSDPFDRPFLAIRYLDKETQEIRVDIFLCRDPEVHRWYQNDERSPEIFSLKRGQSIHFIGRLVKDLHPGFKLV